VAAPRWPLPKFGDLVWCRFPFGGNPTNARHPALVMDIYIEEGADPHVLLIGGTSAHKKGVWTRSIKPTDFVLQGSVLTPAGLTNPTAIQFEADAITTLPWGDTYFVAVAPKLTPIMGSIQLALTRNPLKAAFQAAGQAADLKQLINAEQARVKS
jgi:hypothetical protein